MISESYIGHDGLRLLGGHAGVGQSRDKPNEFLVALRLRELLDVGRRDQVLRGHLELVICVVKLSLDGRGFLVNHLINQLSENSKKTIQTLIAVDSRMNFRYSLTGF